VKFRLERPRKRVSALSINVQHFSPAMVSFINLDLNSPSIRTFALVTDLVYVLEARRHWRNAEEILLRLWNAVWKELQWLWTLIRAEGKCGLVETVPV
jgi:hypothetical protein